MPVKEISGVKFVIRLPDQDTLSEAAKKFLVQEMRPNLNDGKIWIKSVWSDINSELHQLQQLGFNGEDHNDPDVYLYSSDNPYPEIPWALRTPVKYIDDKEPKMQILWVNKESTNLTFEDRPFRIATEEEYASPMAWLNEKEKPNNVLTSPKVTEKIDINATIHGPTGKPKIEPEFFLQISVLMTYVMYDPSEDLPSDCAQGDSPFSGHFCQLLSPVVSSISKRDQPNLRYEVEKTECKLEDLSILFAYRDLFGAKLAAGKENDKRDCFVLAQSNLNSRTIGEFSLPKKHFQSIHNDILANKRMQIFDLRFHNDLQRADNFTVECTEIGSKTNAHQKLRLRSNYDKGGSLYVAEVVARNSMSVSDYIEKMRIDPVFNYSLDRYRDIADVTDLTALDYIARQRTWLEDGKELYPLKTEIKNEISRNE